ncbi:nuclear transport factor 2 family protein [Aminobacter anthyllidis]|uniref:Nuclear transport factor 2 family protein n=1 Tax=Aminobacter anthyllidis TaxID=1035067 RepID=A0A9X1A7I5_9HYPH|nr:nuclear transport factor 2 family protein [Aminobacter anthyllidis]MBT1154679.1 nuclear transport factor 2 family protein [Aminobacter anthyllidis]
MSDIEARFAALEARIKGLEDQLDIYQLFATYGPSVDSRTGSVTASLWAKDGTYDFGGDPLVGAGNVGSLVDIEPHIHYVADGCAHVLSMPHIAVDGDRAVATGYSRVYLNQGDHWRVERASANRWELVRTPEGWRVQNRVNRLLDGQPEARDLLSSGVTQSS